MAKALPVLLARTFANHYKYLIVVTPQRLSMQSHKLYKDSKCRHLSGALHNRGSPQRCFDWQNDLVHNNPMHYELVHRDQVLNNLLHKHAAQTCCTSVRVSSARPVGP